MDNLSNLPNPDGFFGNYGGKFVPETLMYALKELDETYAKLKNDPKFLKEIDLNNAELELIKGMKKDLNAVGFIFDVKDHTYLLY